MEETAEIIYSLSEPVYPDRTEITSSVFKHRKKIKAVLFDLYGTLMVSSAGDISASREKADSDPGGDLFIKALKYCLPVSGGTPGGEMIPCGLENKKGLIKSLFYLEITRAREKMQKQGNPSPEVDIVEIWRSVLSQAGITAKSRKDIEKTAAAYEAMANRTWPMPGMEKTLDRLTNAGAVTGIISNAQFYSPLLFCAYTGKTPEQIGFHKDFCLWSYQHGISKPDPYLFRKAVSALEKKRGISASDTLFVGNDMLNDIKPARETGMVTALFAGDSKSLRLRKDMEDVNNIKPDYILTSLNQVLIILGLQNGV